MHGSNLLIRLINHMENISNIAAPSDYLLHRISVAIPTTSNTTETVSSTANTSTLTQDARLTFSRVRMQPQAK